MFGHPFGAREMAFEGTTGPFGFARWIDVQDDPRHFRPVRAFSVGIEQAQIGHEMLVVISGQIAGRGGLVGNPAIEWRRRHDCVRCASPGGAEAGSNRRDHCRSDDTAR